MQERDVFFTEDFSFYFKQYLKDSSKRSIEQKFENLFSNEPFYLKDHLDHINIEKLSPKFSDYNLKVSEYYFKDNQSFNRLENKFQSIEIWYTVKSKIYLLINSGLDFYTIKDKETCKIFTVPTQSDITMIDVVK